MLDSTQFQMQLEDIAETQLNLRDRQKRLLRANGWVETCGMPGSLWLWSKSFPESKVQWRWAADRKSKEPQPAFTVNGATTEVALQIESSWLDLWAGE